MTKSIYTEIHENSNFEKFWPMLRENWKNQENSLMMFSNQKR